MERDGRWVFFDLGWTLVDETPARLARFAALRSQLPQLMQRFVEWLDPVNGLADESEGFIWRLQADEGFARAERSFGDELLLVNMSVWKSIRHLQAFVLDPNHLQVMKESSRWFLPPDGPHLVLWWVPAGHLPSPDEAKKKLELLAAHGPGPRQRPSRFPRRSLILRRTIRLLERRPFGRRRASTDPSRG